MHEARTALTLHRKTPYPTFHQPAPPLHPPTARQRHRGSHRPRISKGRVWCGGVGCSKCWRSRRLRWRPCRTWHAQAASIARGWAPRYASLRVSWTVSHTHTDEQLPCPVYVVTTGLSATMHTTSVFTSTRLVGDSTHKDPKTLFRPVRVCSFTRSPTNEGGTLCPS